MRPDLSFEKSIISELIFGDKGIIVIFFTGNFNGHTWVWYPDSDTNVKGILLVTLFTKLNLT